MHKCSFSVKQWMLVGLLIWGLEAVSLPRKNYLEMATLFGRGWIEA